MPRQPRRRRQLRPPGVEDHEVWIDTVRGEKLVFPSTQAEPEGVSYVRFVDRRGVEVAYVDSSELVEDPQGTLGAILGAIMRGASPFEER